MISKINLVLKKASFSGALLFLVFGSSASQAYHPNWDGYLSALSGLGMVSNGGGTNFTYGLGVGYNFLPDWSAGLEYNYDTYQVPSPLKASLMLVLGNLKYYFSDGRDLFVGFKLGSGSVLITGANNAPPFSNDFTCGLTAGYNYHFSDYWSAGVEGNYLWVNNARPTLTVFQLMANLTYWL